MTDILRRGRLGTTEGEVATFLSSFENDRRIFDEDIDVGKAHIIALAEQGTVSEKDTREILKALEAVRKAGFDALDDTHEDIHPAIEKAVIERAEGGEEVGGRLHTARSRNDEVATCIRMALREELLVASRDVLTLREALLERAEEHEGVVVSGYTHLQRAQPTTVGHALASYAVALERDFGRLIDAYERTNECPLGSAAFAGTSFEIDRDRTAELLGFREPTRHSTDGVASRDFAVEATSGALNLSITVSRLCEDLILWNSQEFGVVEFDDGYSSTSSIMPQKKNPDTAELARGKTATVQGALNGIASNLKGLPSAYNRDLQEATGHIWDAFDSVRGSTRVLAGAIDTMEVDEEKARETTQEGFICATELADVLVRETGVAFRTAHHIVARLFSEAEGDGSGVDADEVRRVGTDVVGEEFKIEDEKINEALDPESVIESHESYGAPGDDGVIDDGRDRLEQDMDTLNSLEENLKVAEDRLEELEEAIL